MIQKLFHQRHLRVASISRDCKTVKTLLAAAFQYTVEQLVHIFSLCVPSPSESHEKCYPEQSVCNRVSAVTLAVCLPGAQCFDLIVRGPRTIRSSSKVAYVWYGVKITRQIVLNAAFSNSARDWV
jgi:hypothetical protein